MTGGATFRPEWLPREIYGETVTGWRPVWYAAGGEFRYQLFTAREMFTATPDGQLVAAAAIYGMDTP